MGRVQLAFLLLLRLSNDYQKEWSGRGGAGTWEEKSTDSKSSHGPGGAFPEGKTSTKSAPAVATARFPHRPHSVSVSVP